MCQKDRAKKGGKSASTGGNKEEKQAEKSRKWFLLGVSNKKKVNEQEAKKVSEHKNLSVQGLERGVLEGGEGNPRYKVEPV